MPSPPVHKRMEDVMLEAAQERGKKLENVGEKGKDILARAMAYSDMIDQLAEEKPKKWWQL